MKEETLASPKDEALKLALEEMKIANYNSAAERLEAALAQPAQEPVGIVETLGGYPDESRHEVKWLVPYRDLKDGDNLYRTPQQRPWVGLTDEEVSTLWGEWKDAVCLDYKTWAQAIEAKLKELNT